MHNSLGSFVQIGWIVFDFANKMLQTDKNTDFLKTKFAWNVEKLFS